MQTDIKYELRTLTPKDTPAVAELWTTCFGPPFDIYDPANYAQQQLAYLIGAFSDGALQAAAGIIDFDMHVETRWLKAGGIAAVATNPSHRRKGLVEALLRDCLQHLHRNGAAVACLWPFSYSFYEHFGWSTTDMQHSITLATAGLHKLGDARNYRMLEASEFATLMPLHQLWCQQFNLSMSRSERRWRRMLLTKEFVGRIFVHGKGYMIIDLQKSTHERVVIREWAYLSQDAFLDGLALLGQMDSQFETALWNDGRTDMLLRAGVYDAIKEISLRPGMMSRAVNVESLSKELNVPLSDYAIFDKLGVSSQNKTGAPTTNALSPGQLIQLICGAPESPSTALLPLSRPSYSAERY